MILDVMQEPATLEFHEMVGQQPISIWFEYGHRSSRFLDLSDFHNHLVLGKKLLNGGGGFVVSF